MLSARVIRKKQTNYPRAFARVQQQFLPAAGKLVEGSAKALAPIDQGQLRGSIGANVRREHVSIGTNVEYAAHVEYGTRPHFPPISAIQKWAGRVLGDSSKSTAFLIARKISRTGTKAQPYLRPALDTNKRNLVRLFRRIFDRVFSSG